MPALWSHQLSSQGHGENGFSPERVPFHSHHDISLNGKRTDRDVQALSGGEDALTELIGPLGRHDEEVRDWEVDGNARDGLPGGHQTPRRHVVDDQTFPGRDREHGIVNLTALAGYRV